MQNENVLAGIVTYNADIVRLRLNIEAIYKQVKEVLVIDNGSNNVIPIIDLVDKYNNVNLKLNNENKGIAVALNQIGDFAVEKEVEFFLTLDQDSVADDNLVGELLASFESDSIGMTCPYINRKNDFISSNSKHEVKTAITSGAMVKTSVWKEIGGFWEFLFIDEVDHEFSYQIRKNGYSILQTNSVAINHIIGNPFSKKILGHQFNPTNHSAFRRYYIARNNLIMQHLYPEEKEPFQHRYRMLMKMTISILFCENNKVSKIRAICRGIKDAIIWSIKNKDIYERRELHDRCYS